MPVVTEWLVTELGTTLGRESKVELELKLEVRSPDCKNEDELR